MSLNRSHCLSSAALLFALAVATPFTAPARAMMPPSSGVAPAEMIQALEDGLIHTPQPAEGLPTSVTQSTWRIPVILVSFSDSLLTHTAAQFNHTLFDTSGSTATGSAYDYYRWISGGRFTLTGEVVATVHLSHDRLYYGNNNWGLSRESPNNAFGLVWDAVTICNPSVNWSDYDLDHDGFVDMVWVVHAGIGGETSQDRNNLWSITSRLASGWRNGTFYTTSDPVPGSTTQKMRIDQFTILPELSSFRPGSIAEIGVYCHEFGHALGLPDLYTVALFTGQIDLGPGCWSLMSVGAYGLDTRSPEFPAHIGAWPLQYLGWDRTVRPDRDTTLTLDPLGSDGSILELTFQGESQPEHFLIENRQKLSFDRNAIAEGLIVYHVDESIIWQRLRLNSINSGGTPGLRVVEADGDEDLVVSRNLGDANDPFPGALNRTRFDDDTYPSARTFNGARSNVALERIERVGDRMRFRAIVEARGWLPPVDRTGDGLATVESHGLARTSGVDARGNAYWVASETRDGLPEIYLRSGLDAWTGPERVSHSPASADEPAIAVMPGGDLAIVWSDDRSGRSEIWYRSRIQGVWTEERPLVSMSGECRAPAIAADARGGLSMAFLYFGAGAPQIRFMRFTWFSPFGQSLPVTTVDQRPGLPAIAAGANGVAYVVWSDWSASPQRLFFARCHPDSGVAGNYPLTYKPNVAQLDPNAAVDARGSLHVVWHASGPGVSHIHYHRRPMFGAVLPDTILDNKGYLLQNASLAVDTANVIHIAYESFPTGSAELRYLRTSAATGWDATSTRITNPTEGIASDAQLLPIAKDDLLIGYRQHRDDGYHLFTRRRLLVPGAAAVSEPLAVVASLRAGPNPIRPGQSMRLWYAGPLAAERSLDLFDVAGRRLGRFAFSRSATGWHAHVPASATTSWPAGVLFARVAGSRAELRLVVLR